jgi:hypothetical protein
VMPSSGLVFTNSPAPFSRCRPGASSATDLPTPLVPSGLRRCSAREGGRRARICQRCRAPQIDRFVAGTAPGEIRMARNAKKDPVLGLDPARNRR